MRLRDWSLGIIGAASLAGRRTGAVVLLLLFGSIAQAAQPVLQRGYNEGVSGANLAETTLNTTNVTPSTFGLVFMLPVDDAVFAQPLYVPNVAIPNLGTHNVVYVATMSDTLYAFDADTGGAPLWSVNFASLVDATPVAIADFVFSGSKNIVGNLGILSTPVIDASTHIMYLVACTLENGTLAYRLHAVDITTGTEPYGPGQLISGSYGSSPAVTFDAPYQTQRVSLVLSGNQVVFAFGAMELEYSGGYVGWVMAYDKQTLQQSGIFATIPTAAGRGGGVWQSGRPPAVDSAGHVYVFVGNGYGCCGYDGAENFSESVLKLDPANGLKLLNWFTPGNWNDLDAADLDLSSSGPLLIPGTNPRLLAGGGKNCELYVLSTSQLGKFNATDSQVVQKEKICASSFRGGPVYWQRSAANGGPLLYNWGSSDWAKAYALNGTQFAATPSSQGSVTQIWPGGILTLSANGEAHGSGVLWATVATSGDANNDPPVPGEVRAFNAENVSQELWNSAMNATRDGFGNFAKFVPPLVANGKVYVATWSNQLAVYGLLQQATTTGISSSANPSTYGQSVTFTATVTSSSGTPTGKVNFMINGTSMGIITLTGGVATLTKIFQGVATKSITAVYAGSTAFAGSTSSVLSQAVNPASTQVALTSSQNPATVGQPVILTATVSSSSGAPTGRVTFMNGSSMLGTATLAGGVATLTKTFTGLATKSITAMYPGNMDFSGSTSSVLTQVVNPAPP